MKRWIGVLIAAAIVLQVVCGLVSAYYMGKQVGRVEGVEWCRK